MTLPLNIHITKLSLKGMGLKEIPNELFKYHRLKKLDLSNNELTSIPKEISRLKYLQTIDFSNNQITALYSGLFELKKLRILNLNRNRIKNIPDSFSKLKGLRILSLSNNKLVTFPFPVSNLRNLEELNLSFNQISYFPLFNENLKLKRLWINNNCFENFTKSFIKLPNLHYLYCFGKLNRISKISPEYLSLSKIRGNCIRYLTEQLHSNDIIPIENNENSVSMSKNKVFISYSHDDIDWYKKVITHLNALKHLGLDLEIWSDVKIKTGDNWKREIENALNTCSFAILLISTNFLASDFIQNNELPPLLGSAQKKGTRLFSIILTPCLYSKFDNLSIFQAINPPDKSLLKCQPFEQEEFLVKMCNEIDSQLNNK